MNATECFKVTEIGRCDIDGVEFVGYYDGARSYAVLGSDYDQVERLIADIDEYEPGRGDNTLRDEYWANCYSEWCGRCVSIGQSTTAAVAAALELDGLFSSDGTDTWVAAAADNDDREYRIAFVRESGNWDVVESFAASGDNTANAYAEREYGDQDWYVLDSQGRNINCGPDQAA